MPKATKKPGDPTVETADPTDNRPVEPESQPDRTGETAEPGKARSAAEELEELVKKTEQAKTELASIQKGREAEEAKLSKIREEIRAERAARGMTAETAEPIPAPTYAPAPQPPQDEDYDLATVEGWQRHIDRETERKLKPVVSEFEAFKQSSRKKAIREFMSRHQDYRGGDEKKFSELIVVAERNGFKDTFHAEDALEVLEGSWAFIHRDAVLGKARAADGAAVETENAVFNTATGDSLGREGSTGAATPQATQKDVRAAQFAKMPLEKYLKLKKQAEDQGFFVEAPAVG